MVHPSRAPIIVTVELVGGPQDGHLQDYRRAHGEEMPDTLCGAYLLHSRDNRARPERWRYQWPGVAPAPRRRRSCQVDGGRCTAAGCPNQRQPP